MQEPLRGLEKFIEEYAWRDEKDGAEALAMLKRINDSMLKLPTDIVGNVLSITDRFSYNGGCFSVAGVDAGGVFYRDAMTDKMKRGYGFRGSLTRYITGNCVRRDRSVDERKWDVYEAPRRCSAYRWEGDFIVDGEYDCPKWCQDALRNKTFTFDGQGELHLEGEHVPVGSYLVRYPDGSILWCDEEGYNRGFMTGRQVASGVTGGQDVE